MFQKFLLLCSFLFLCFIPTSFAHDFNEDTLEYILSNPSVTLSEFEAQLSSFNDEELEGKLENTDTKIAAILALPGKKYLANYAVANPEFTYSDIKEQIGDDPMLSELGVELIYSFLSERLQENAWYSISWDFFKQIVTMGLTHILSGIDHILFVITLIILFPKKKHILALVTIFTLSHSLTIVLGGFQILSLPSVFVESMILISIILTAVYAFLGKVGEEKNVFVELFVVFFLGLFHGLGFAGFFGSVIDVSSNIAFPIFAFNIGVEIGQIFIILIAYCILHFLYTHFPKYKNIVKNSIAVFCIVIALYMLVGMYL